MKINLEELSEILSVFVEAGTAHINVSALRKSDVDVVTDLDDFHESFIFHMQIALDNQLVANVEGDSTNLKSIGITYSSRGPSYYVDRPIRLTQKGHDFSAALQNKEVLSKLKSEFKNAPFTVIFDGSQNLIQHYFKKKLDEIID